MANARLSMGTPAVPSSTSPTTEKVRKSTIRKVIDI